MYRCLWKPLFVATVLLGVFFVGAVEAEACWWCRPAYGCYTACYTPCCTVTYRPCCTVTYDPCCYTGGWYLGYRPGPVRRLLFGPYRWYYPYWGWPSVYYTDRVYTYADEVGEPAGEPTPAPPKEPTPVEAKMGPTLAEPPEPPPETEPVAEPPIPKTTEPAGPAPTPGPDEVPAEPPAPAKPTTRTIPARGDNGLLSLRVPAEAKVIVNGLETKSTGTHREYISYGLKPGSVYKYEVRAQIVRGGRLVEQTRIVYLSAGVHKALAFHFRPRPEEAIARLP